MKSNLSLSGIVVAAAFVLAGTAQAGVIYSMGTSTSTFKSVEFEDNDNNFHSTNGSSVTHYTDSAEGSAFKFHKDDLDRRCEVKGAAGFTPAKGSTYYIGWRLKIGSLTNNNSYFQWKSYGSPMVQNYPVVLKMINGQLNFEHYAAGQSRVTLWKHSVSANTWYSIVIKIKYHDDPSQGNIQFFFGNDTAPETLLTGGTSYTGKTFDGTGNEPKWGYYGETNTNEDTAIARLKIGSAYADVKPF